MSKLAESVTLTPPKRASLLQNAVALYALQIANYVIPIITLPYLIRVLGADQYGAMAIAYAIVFFMVLFVDGGINSFAVKELSQCDISSQKINHIYVTTQAIKFALVVFCFVLLVALIALVPAARERADLMLVSFMLVVGSMLFSTWLFQGLEIMHVTTVCSVGGRLLATVAIFLFVHGPEDLLLAALLQASATAISGLMAITFLRTGLNLRLQLPWAELMSHVRHYLLKARGLWVSEFATSAVTNSGVFILSFFVGDAAVGIYAAVEKIANAALNAFQPLQKALFPKMTSHWRLNKSVSYQQSWTLRLVVLASIAAGGLFLLSPLTLQVLFGQGWVEHANLLRVVAIWLVIAVSASTLNQFWLLASGSHALYGRTLIIAASVQLGFSIIGAAAGGAFGMLVALLVAEMLRLLLGFLAVKYI